MKRHQENLKKVDREKRYPLEEAVQVLSQIKGEKFDETVDIAIRLGVDPKQSDQNVRGAVGLPHGIGKTLKVAVFAKGEKAEEATKGLMHNPKLGTVTMDVARAVKELKAGKVEFRLDKAGIVHAVVGRKSFEPKKLKENIQTLMDAVVKAKPASSKGNYLRSIAISSTMGPGIKLDPAEFMTAV